MGFISSVFGYVLNYLYVLLNNYGISIIIFSFLLRLILIPITLKQQKAMKKSAEMQEKMKEIQTKYKNNPEKLNQATIDLYKEEKMSPFSGCFSAILQLVIILSVFWLVSQPLTYMKKINKEIIDNYKSKIIEENEGQRVTYPEIAIISKIEQEYKDIEDKLSNNKEEIQEDINTDNNENKIEDNNKNNEVILTKEDLENKKNELETMRINMEFLGLDLSKVPTQSLDDWKVYIIPILYVITSFISIKLTTNVQNKQIKTDKNNSIEKDNNFNEENKEDDLADSMGQMNNTMQYMMPIMSISIAAIAPLGLALYWFVSNILMIIERLIINKFIKSKGEE